MSNELRSVLAGIRRHQAGRAHAQVRYPKEIREAVVRWARTERARSRSVSSLAGELGVNVGTVKRWVEPVSEGGKLERVVVAKPKPAAEDEKRLVLVTRQGHRVEGLDIAGLVELLVALS